MGPLHSWVTSAYIFLLAGLAIHLGWKALARWRRLRQPQFLRIQPAELHEKIEREEPLIVLDLRHALDRLATPYSIPGALWLPPNDLSEPVVIPRALRQQPVVFYCTCPNGASTLNLARMLQQRGVKQIRPLCGGIEAWRRAGFGVEQIHSQTDQHALRAASSE